MSGLRELLSQSYDALATTPVATLKDKQAEAFASSQRMGFPTRKDERWKYTSVESLLSTHFDGKPQALTDNVQTITVHDGALYLPADLPQGVTVSSTLSALEKEPELLKESLGVDAFAALNLALLDGGVCIRVAKGVQCDKPIEVVYSHSDSALTHHLRNLYVIEEGANASIIETFASEVEASYFHNINTEISLGQQAQLEHFTTLDEGENAYHIGLINLYQARDSKARLHSYNYGAKLSRLEVNVALTESGADAELYGLYVLGGRMHAANYTCLNHQSAHATSNEVYKGIISDSASAVFNGNIMVANDAQKTNASLSNKNILLSPSASVDTKPQLEIFADDVKCAHGTTVGQLDDKAIFYLQSRGISELDAKQMLVKAFASDVIDNVSDDELKQRFNQLFEEKLRKVA